MPKLFSSLMGQHQPLKEILLFLYANIFFQGELDSNQAKPGCQVARLPGCLVARRVSSHHYHFYVIILLTTT